MTLARAAALLLLLASPGGSASADAGPAPEAPAARRPIRSLRDYQVPAVHLVRQDGQVVSLPEEMDDGRPVVLNFIFTTCTAICPVTSQVFAEAQKLLAPQARRLHMMSISIDPENDTPARLREYAHRFSAGPQWNHYTGTTAASIEMQRAFNTYRGDKMNHQPVTFLRKARDAQWVRMEGFVAPSDLAAEVRTLLG